MDNPHRVFFSPKFDGIEYSLILLVRLYPLLYDPSDKSYNDSEETSSAWMNISDELGKSPKWCKAKWKDLRTCYGDRKKLGSRGEDWPFWPYDNAMKFLDELIEIPSAHKPEGSKLSGEEAGAGSSSGRTQIPFPTTLSVQEEDADEVTTEPETVTCCCRMM